jgi:uncharacterized repeat protein (TIGR03803 family)
MAKGGASGYGTVFRLVLDGSLELLLHSFGPSDGEYPYTAGLVQAKDGMLYGVTQQGGAAGGGTVFSINPDGSGFQLLHEFGATPSDGRYPNSSLVLGTDGFLYGATELGGASNLGALFRVSTDGLSYQVLHTFSGGGGDGANPGAPLIQATDGGLFGTTKFGGAGNLGAVFRVAPASPLLSSVVAQGDKTVRLTVTSASNFIYRIDGSTDHTHWVPLTNLTNTTGSVEFKDTGASNTLQKFYRAVWVP